jgi:hypothetical protein
MHALYIEGQQKSATEQNTVEAAWLISDYNGNQLRYLVGIYHNQMHDEVSCQQITFIHNPISANRKT